MCAFSMPNRKKDSRGLYNDFLMPSMDLPVNVEGRVERVAAVQKVMAGLKVKENSVDFYFLTFNPIFFTPT